MASMEIAQKACQILIPYSFKEILDGAVAFDGPKDQLFDYLNGPLSFFAWMCLGILVFSRASGALLVYFGPRLRKMTREKIYHYLQYQSHRYFISNFSGSLANRINEVSMGVNHGLWTVMFDFLPVAVSFCVTLFLLYSANSGLALFLAFWVFVYVSISFLLATRCQKYSRTFAAERSRTTGHIVDAVTNVMNTKLFARLPFERHRLNKQLDVEVEKATETMWFFEKMRWFQFIAGLILQLGTIVYALVLFRDGAISVGSFAMVATLSLVIIDDSRGLSRRFLEFFEYMGNISDGVKILVKPHEIQDMENAKDLVAKDGALEFKDVCFSYAEGKSVFENLNVKIKPGEKVGLVGFSGSGKTTFVNLILRLFDIQEGQISIDDQNIQTHTQDSLRSSISMIPQDPVLFHRTLLENIRYGNPSATDEQVKEAARMAHAHDFILETEDGYQSLVGERGVKLSGGQRQRVAISRAILKDAPLLVMDEATSSLDSITEKAIQNTLDTIMKDKTVIVVAHRLSTISHLDRILVFNEGRIIEDGSHETLLKENGHYARLWSMQAGGFLPSRDTESTETQTPSNPRPTL
tara:strand:- start:148493 stop:150235 length:1743 start_codon:yes stop_codon:yes gene_type:complete